MPDDHSEVEPLLPIPNRTVKRFSADDSEHALVKVGHRQAVTKTTPKTSGLGGCSIWGNRKSQQAYAAHRRHFSLAALGFLSGCGVFPGSRPALPLEQDAPALQNRNHQPARFSARTAADALPDTWQPYVLVRSKKPTEYGLIDDGNRTVLRARANGKAATGLFHRILRNQAPVPNTIAWSWKSDGPAPEADVSDTWADDSPGRIIAAFEGDVTQFGFRDRLFFDQVRLFTGIDLPFATLIYVWDPRLPVGSVVTVPQTTRIRYLVVESGALNADRWVSYQRDLASDYQLAFGSAPNPLSAVGLMTDSDDIGQSVQTLYQDIVLDWGLS